MKRLNAALIATAALFTGTATQAQREAPFTVLESGQGFGRLQDAVNAIGSGNGSIRIAPGSYGDCAVQTAGQVAYLAGAPGQVIFDGGACEGKATLVLRGSAARVEGLIFQNIRVADRNGAGIRLERGNLAISQSWFRDSEQGVLSGDDPASTITVEKSTFTRLGGCPGGMCSHSLYIGNYGGLSVTRSRFEHGTGGHYVKSRAARVQIAQSSFDDTGGTETNYMIDLPGGATGAITNNAFVQGRSKENYSAFITVAPEGKQHSSNGLVIEGNDARIAPGVSRDTFFVADWAGDTLRIGANRLGAGVARYERR